MTEFETKALELLAQMNKRLEKIEDVATWFQKRIEGNDRAMAASRRLFDEPPGG
jgi:hypothetical protein